MYMIHLGLWIIWFLGIWFPDIMIVFPNEIMIIPIHIHMAVNPMERKRKGIQPCESL